MEKKIKSKNQKIKKSKNQKSKIKNQKNPIFDFSPPNKQTST
jgi:hypothetical protein